MAALNGPQDIVRERCAIFEARRDAIVPRINAVPGLACSPPAGAFYVYVSCAGWLGKCTPQGGVLETDADTEAVGWRREGMTISTDSDEVFVRYLKAETDTAKFSPKFTMALVAYLAARLAFPVTRDRVFSQFRMQLYEAAMAECLAAENADRSP